LKRCERGSTILLKNSTPSIGCLNPGGKVRMKKRAKKKGVPGGPLRNSEEEDTGEALTKINKGKRQSDKKVPGTKRVAWQAGKTRQLENKKQKKCFPPKTPNRGGGETKGHCVLVQNISRKSRMNKAGNGKRFPRPRGTKREVEKQSENAGGERQEKGGLKLMDPKRWSIVLPKFRISAHQLGDQTCKGGGDSRI